MNSNVMAAKKKVDSAFIKKGVFIAIMSGVTSFSFQTQSTEGESQIIYYY